MIPYGRQNISQADINSVIEVLKSDYLTQGPKVPEFEKALNIYAGSKFAYAMNSATSALHVACLALGLDKGDILWTSPVSFVASANAGLYCGAKIDFVDIDLKTYNICPEKLKEKLHLANLNNTLPKILIPVHLCGEPCDMREIKQICLEYNVKIIEDASHAIGASYLNASVGNCAYSDITVFSFHPVKIITTCEGGAALTNDEYLANRIELFRSHGITRNEKMMTEPSHGLWYYQQIELGYNYRMTDIQAALGLSQMGKLTDFIHKRHQISKRYDNLLKDLPVLTPNKNKNSYSSLHLYVIRLELNKIHISHKKTFKNLRDNGIGVNLHYIPIHLQPFYRSLGFKEGDFPEAEKYYGEAISLPIFPSLSESEQNKVVEVLTSVIS